MSLETVGIVLCVLAALIAGFLIPVIMELRRTIVQARETMTTAERNLSSTLHELDESLRSLRQITDRVNQAASDVTSITGGLSSVAHDLRLTMKHTEKLVRRLPGNFSAVRAALSAAAAVIINSLRGDRK